MASQIVIRPTENGDVMIIITDDGASPGVLKPTVSDGIHTAVLKPGDALKVAASIAGMMSHHFDPPAVERPEHTTPRILTPN
jgi:hypothetical protein